MSNNSNQPEYRWFKVGEGRWVYRKVDQEQEQKQAQAPAIRRWDSDQEFHNLPDDGPRKFRTRREAVAYCNSRGLRLGALE